jgi:hypothetical protein
MSAFVESMVRRNDQPALVQHAERFEFLRKIRPDQFALLKSAAVRSGKNFDSVVDDAMRDRVVITEV